MESTLCLAAHKLILFATQIKWCGKVYLGTSVKPDPERIRGLVEMRRPETYGELMKFFQEVIWMHLSLPSVAEVMSPLRALMEGSSNGTIRTKRAASRRAIAEEDWATERAEASENFHQFLMHARLS